MPKFNIIPLFLIFLTWGILIRSYALPHLSIWMDEGYSFLASEHFFQNGIYLETGFAYGIFNIIPHFFEALFLKIFGINEWGARLPALFINILFITTLFFSFKKNFFLIPTSSPYTKNQNIQFEIINIIFLFFLLFSTWEIAWSIQGRGYAFIQAFFVFGVFFLWKFFQEQNLKNLLFFFLFSFFALFSHFFGIFLFVLFLIFAPFFLREKKWLWTIILPMSIIFYQGQNFFLNFFENINFEFFYIRFLEEQHLGILILSVISSLLIFIKGEKKQKKFLLFLWGSLLIPLFCIEFFLDTVAYRYLFPLYPILLFISLFFLTLQNLKLKIYNFFIPIFPISFIFISIFLFSELTLFPQKKIYLESDLPKKEGIYRSFTPQPNFKVAIQTFLDQKKENDILITSFPEITRFYGIKPDFVLPFDWEEKKDQKSLKNKKREYVAIPHIYDLKTIDEIAQKHHGFFLLDAYAYNHLSNEITGYIESSSKKIGEEWENEDSGILLYQF